MSLIGTRHQNGPSTTSTMITDRMTMLASASRWRRNRRQASAQGETRRRGAAATAVIGASGAGAPAAAFGACASTVGDAWVEPAIDQVCQQVEQDDEAGEHERHRHDDGRVVGEDRGDEQRADAGDAE